LGCVQCSVGLLQSIEVTPGGRYDVCYDLPLMRLRSTSEVCDQSVYRPIWLDDPGCVFRSSNELTYTLTGIPADQPATPPKRSSSSHAVAPTSGFNPTWPADLAARASPKTSQSGSISDSHGVSSPTTLEPERVYSTPACHTDYVPSSGFRTLSTACSSLGRPALFHAGNAHGVAPFRGFPSLSGLTSSSPLRLPSWRFSSAKRSKLRNARAPDSPQTPSRACVTSLFRLQGFAPTVNPYRCWTVTSVASGRSPPELSPPLQGLALVSRPRRASREPLLRFTASSSNSLPRDESRNRPRIQRVRFSGFACKRWISLRKAKYPLLRFLRPSHVMFPS
jgi:hypothetical protein